MRARFKVDIQGRSTRSFACLLDCQNFRVLHAFIAVKCFTNDITGVTPDFIFPAITNNAGHSYFPCGMVCWGAPGVVPPNPPTWSHTNRDNFVDCVAYGGYSGARQTSDMAATRGTSQNSATNCSRCRKRIVG